MTARLATGALAAAAAALAHGGVAVAQETPRAPTAEQAPLPPPARQKPPVPEAQQTPLVVGDWVPGARVTPDPLPLTDAARRDVHALEGALPCAAPGMPALLDTRGAVEIAQQGDRLRMRYVEWGDAVRTVYMNPRNGPATQAPSPLGVSFGRWEGQTLAIFTTYIAYPYFDRAGTGQSAAVTVLERYTPSADRTRLDWKVTVTDAATFTAPVVITGSMAARDAAASDAPAAARDAPAAAGESASDDAALPNVPTATPLVASGCVG